MECCPSGWRSM